MKCLVRERSFKDALMDDDDDGREEKVGRHFMRWLVLVLVFATTIRYGRDRSDTVMKFIFW